MKNLFKNIRYWYSVFRNGDWDYGFSQHPNITEEKQRWKDEGIDPSGCGCWGNKYISYHKDYYDGFFRTIWIGNFYINNWH